MSLDRLECAGETLRHALNVLAEVAPDWLLAQTPPEWFERYSRRFDEYGIVNLKKSLGEFSPLNLHLGALIGTLSKKFWVDAPLSYRIRRNYLCNCY